MLKRLVMVRHGETDLNKAGVLQGQRDTQLNSRGQQQARRVAEVLRSEPLDAIWSSPLLRAQQTAEQINRFHHHTITTHAALLERSFGDYEGMPVNELIQNEADRGDFLFAQPVANGESLQQLFLRAEQLVDEIRACQHETLLLVGHAGIFRALIGALLTMDFEQWFALPQHNSCLNTFIFDQGEITAYQIDEHSHCY